MQASQSWWVVVPVKDRLVGKSRLQPPPGVGRPELAEAFAADTLNAVIDCVGTGRLVVVGSAPSQVDVDALADDGGGLNAAVRQGFSYAVSHGAGRVAVVLGDHPSLTADALGEALELCGAWPAAVIPDSDSSGTALLTCRADHPFSPSFGGGSFEAHRTWAHPVIVDSPRLRVDVDDARSLGEALRLGVGRHTAAALARRIG